MNGRDRDALPLAQPLTPREEEILDCLGDEMSNRQIAEHLTVSLNTVKWYVRQIYNKLGVDNRGEAVIRARDLGLLPPGEQGGPIRNNLPLAATPFVGRARELDALADLIADPQARLITISGPGGIGKTRLALEAARREMQLVPVSAGMTSSFSDGVYFVSLAPLESAAEIVSTLATVLDFHFQDSRNEQEQLLNYLRNKQMLLVMDNFEHILDGRSLLAQINEQAAEITLLVTSRERLQMHGEQRFPLGGLKTAQSGHSVEESPAAELFLDIARRTVPDFEILAGDGGHLLRICRLVGGMPLGLELAASWAGLLPLSEIAAELEQSLDILVTEHHDVPPRHQSMEAALDVSWRRLTSEQQRTLKGLTVFRGGFTRTAAADVAGATLPLLVTLANKSWLSYDRQKDRYLIHELLRQYGDGKLSADPAHEREVQERHSTYFCAYLHAREADWFGPRQKEAAAEIRDEIDNIQRAWRWAAAQGNNVLLDQGLQSLCRFYYREGRLKDGQTACRLAGNGLSRSPDGQQIDDAQRLATWAHVLEWESGFVNEVMRKEALLDQSQWLLDQATQAGRDTRTEQAFIFMGKAYAAGYTDFEEAIRFANVGLELFQELGSRAGEAEALMVMGYDYLSLGEYNLADELLRNSLQIRRQMADRQGIAESINLLGVAARYLGHFEESEMLHRQGLELIQSLGNRLREARWLDSLSYALSWAGEFFAAEEAVRQANKIDQDFGQYPSPWRLNPLAMATFHLGRYGQARSIANENLNLAAQRGILEANMWALIILGNIAFIEGNLVESRGYLQESVALLTKLNQQVHLATIQAFLSYVVRAQGDSGSAREYLIDVLRSCIETRFIFPIMNSLPLAALLAADEDRPERALELYGLALRFGYIRNSRWFADVAGRELDEVRASLPAEKAADAEARGREMNVWETAETLLRELEKSSRSTL